MSELFVGVGIKSICLFTDNESDKCGEGVHG